MPTRCRALTSGHLMAAQKGAELAAREEGQRLPDGGVRLIEDLSHSPNTTCLLRGSGRAGDRGLPTLIRATRGHGFTTGAEDEGRERDKCHRPTRTSPPSQNA